ncbi:ATP-dependent DNA helicase RecQ [Mariniblastus fucicola]|uniref:DNA 3'-5' helicase n=2 Tax=Mariniblastus fucicola TaxID=980251 RepID=A0A5B9PSI6_9BACT|nr:ATP-dependent DNA helicase RecQ [Mariniblastus fucicola]
MPNSQTNPTDVLEEYFGFSEFKFGQQDVISRLLDGKSTLAVFPTGGGKSLCYQLPALMLDHLTIVVSPLIALMKDQIDQLHSKGICAIRLDSSLTLEEYRDSIAKIRSGEAKILYVAPERFFNERFRGSLGGTKVSLFAIDEAHCISQWGHNFRPDYLKMKGIAEKLSAERVLCLTATAAPPVQDDIRNTFNIAEEDAVCTPFFRPNLHIRSQVVTAEQRDSLLIEKLQNSEPGATIIYVTLQKTAESVANLCQSAGLNARAYHAGMDAETRSEIQEWFMQGESHIVVATIAFGMGIDKANIRYVYHYNPPKSIESYAQEIGRAGRDGNVSRCETILVPEDRITLENFVYGDTPTLPSIQTFVDEIAKQPDEFFISPTKLSNYCDIRSIVTQTLMTYLELDGYLASTSPRYDSYKFKPNVSGAELIGKFQGERQEFVRGLLSCSKKQRIWFTIDIGEAMKRLNCDRQRVIKALDFFAENDWIELKASGLVRGYRTLRSFDSNQSIAESFYEKVTSRETNEIDRTQKWFDLAAAKACQPGILSVHFGQPLSEPCGECSFCIGDGPFEIPEPSAAKIDESTLQTVRNLALEHPDALNTPRAIARFLCGIRSPALTRAKLSRHQSFGCCEEIPFGLIIQQVDSHFAAKQ